MNPPIDLNDPARFDVREIPCRIKHAMIFQRWTELAVGAHFVLVNDHDPVPLYYQFAAQFPGAFTWDYLERGPEEFAVKITRLATAPATEPIAPSTGGCASVRRDGAALDLRGLEPPEPMLRILGAIEELAAGGTLRAITDRKPVHLLAELDTRGLAHSSHEQADGSWLNTFKR